MRHENSWRFRDRDRNILWNRLTPFFDLIPTQTIFNVMSSVQKAGDLKLGETPRDFKDEACRPDMPTNTTQPHTHQFVCSTQHRHHDAVNPMTEQPYGIPIAPGHFPGGVIAAVAGVNHGPEVQAFTAREPELVTMPIPEPYDPNPDTSTNVNGTQQAAAMDKDRAGLAMGHGMDMPQPRHEGTNGDAHGSPLGPPSASNRSTVSTSAGGGHQGQQRLVGPEDATATQELSSVTTPTKNAVAGREIPAQGSQDFLQRPPRGKDKTFRGTEHSEDEHHDAPRQDSGKAGFDSDKSKVTQGRKTWTTEGPSHLHLRPGESFTERETRVHTGLESGGTKVTITDQHGAREEKSTYNLRPGETITEEVEIVHHRDGKPSTTVSHTKGSRRMSLRGRRKSVVSVGAAVAADVGAGAVGMDNPGSPSAKAPAGATSAHPKGKITNRIFGRAEKIAGRVTHNEVLIHKGEEMIEAGRKN
ncbi:unnamed protein product [Cyclocybe aegerita]|uniref:Uncharacterized protein n=1 Tax=Cyclocybe aegerita TaxID=1973307 RepID=A0A8S0VRB6_CYCAE|nr:unnamed protein product [Cyclocybe aegerita]